MTALQSILVREYRAGFISKAEFIRYWRGRMTICEALYFLKDEAEQKENTAARDIAVKVVENLPIEVLEKEVE